MRIAARKHGRKLLRTAGPILRGAEGGGRMTRAYRLSPEGRAKRVAVLKALHADQEFAKAHAERSSKLLRDMWRKAKAT